MSADFRVIPRSICNSNTGVFGAAPVIVRSSSALARLSSRVAVFKAKCPLDIKIADTWQVLQTDGPGKGRMHGNTVNLRTAFGNKIEFLHDLHESLAKDFRGVVDRGDSRKKTVRGRHLNSSRTRPGASRPAPAGFRLTRSASRPPRLVVFVSRLATKEIVPKLRRFKPYRRKLVFDVAADRDLAPGRQELLKAPNFVPH